MDGCYNACYSVGHIFTAFINLRCAVYQPMKRFPSLDRELPFLRVPSKDLTLIGIALNETPVLSRLYMGARLGDVWVLQQQGAH